MKRFSVLFAVLLLTFGLIMPLRAAAESPAGQNLLISEVKLGESKPAAEEPVREFVTIYNPNPASVTLDGWRLDYAKPGMTADQCGATQWSGSSAKAYPIAGMTIPANSAASVQVALTDASAGTLRLVNSDSAVQDMVGWLGKAGEQAPCAEGSAASWPAAGTSIQRYVICDSTAAVDTSNNGADFHTNAAPVLHALPTAFLPICAPAAPVDTPATPLACSGISISEILPNPSGSDTGHEFIELYNPTDGALDIAACSLQTTAANKIASLQGETPLGPHEYRALYDGVTGLTLANASGGTVYLLASDTEVFSATYPGAMNDDTSWSWLGSSWEISYAPTPGQQNVAQAEKPCADGETRSGTTGHCQAVSSTEAAGLLPCKPGQERNAATNRCRNVATATSTGLTPCKPGQTRNPETNRCRAAAAAASTLQPCAEGWERNPATNRCRKTTKTASGQLAKVEEDAAPSSGAQWQWWAAGLATTGAAGYGLYEWRDNVRRWLAQLRMGSLRLGRR